MITHYWAGSYALLADSDAAAAAVVVVVVVVVADVVKVSKYVVKAVDCDCSLSHSSVVVSHSPPHLRDRVS